MSDYNEPAYRQAPRESLYPDPAYGQHSSGQPSLSTRRTPRYSRTSNPSWVSNPTMLSPPAFGARPASSVASRPLPAPSPVPSRVISDFAPIYPPPSELGPEPEAEAYTITPPDARDEREQWEPETENMTMTMSMNDDDAYTTYHEPRRSPPLAIDTSAYHIPPEPQYDEPKKRHFVGGFVASLKGLGKLPKAVVKSHFYDRKSTRKGAPGTEQPTGPDQSYYLPAYEEAQAGPSNLNPSGSQFTPDAGMPISKSPTQLPPLDLSTSPRTSHPRSSRRSSSHAHISSPRFRSPVRSPVLVEPPPASDYAKMDSPTAPPDDSFGAHFARLRNFIQQVKSLPWTSDRVALDYFPENSSRARAGKTSKPWYTATHQEIDLLAVPVLPPARMATIQLQRGDDRAMSASVRSASRPRPDGRSPVSYVTSPGMLPSPGASSHGHGQHAVSYSYYFAPPQPLYVYQSPMTSPMTNHGSRSSASSMSPETHQAVPVYMMAGPPPGLIATPPPVLHASQHHHSSRGVSPQVNVPPGQPPSHQRHSGSNSH